jgi:general secretion pathway protein M
MSANLGSGLARPVARGPIAALAPLRTWWAGLAPRERRMVSLMLAAVAAFLLWVIAIAPAWRTLRSAPAELAQLEQQLQQMRRQAAESRELRGTAPVAAAQASVALKAATDRLGADRAKLALQPDRAVLTLQGVTGEQLRSWLSEARSGARARPVEAQLSRGPQGYTGTLVVSLGAGA